MSKSNIVPFEPTEQGIDLACGKVAIRPESIVTFTIKPEIEIKTIDVTQIVSAIESLSTHPTPLLIYSNTHSLSLRGKISLSTMQCVNAVAMLVVSGVQYEAGRFFMTYNKPCYPMRLFYAEQHAIDWLREYIHHK